MTSRERILKALRHEDSDKVPVDLGSTESSGITWIAYENLKEELGLTGDTKIFDLLQMIVKVEDEVLDAVGSDAQPLLIEPREWKPFEFVKEKKVLVPALARIEKGQNGQTAILSEDGIQISRCPKDGIYFDSIYHAFQTARSTDDIDKGFDILRSTDLPYYMDEDFDSLGSRAKRLKEETSRAIVGNLWVHLLAAGQDLFGYEDFMIRLVSDKKLVHHYFERQIEAYIPRIDDYIEKAGQYLDIIQVNDDLGTQNGLMLSTGLYNEMIRPYHARLWAYIKQKSKKYILLHSCGSVYGLIPGFIEMGVDALNPVQVSARDMDTAKLKKEFGKDITFWGGGCDTQKILPYGSVKDVKEEVKRRVDDLYKDGGFIFCQVHNIQPDVPPQNILAMYEALDEFKR